MLKNGIMGLPLESIPLYVAQAGTSWNLVRDPDDLAQLQTADYAVNSS